MIQYARIPVKVNLPPIQAEVMAITRDWIPHFNRVNYEGEWSVLPLRTPGGRTDMIIPDIMEEVEYQDTSLLQQCPSLQQLLHWFECPLLSVRLMNLKKGSVIKPHRDPELCFEQGEVRLHIPIFTNEGVSFYSEEQLLNMREGECWYVNVNLPHRVENKGVSDRVHLVIDCGVNDWIKALFEKSDCTLVDPSRYEAETAMIIAELKRQNTPVSLQLARDLESQVRI